MVSITPHTDFSRSGATDPSASRSLGPAASAIAGVSPLLSPAPLYDAENSAEFLRPHDGLGLARNMVIEAALRRGLRVDLLSPRIYRVSSAETFDDFTLGMSSRVPHVTRLQTNSKTVAKRLLQEAGLPVPEGRQFSPEAVETAWTFARSRLPVVVKPAVGSFANGVTVAIDSEDSFRAAFAKAARGRRFQVVVEHYVEGNDYRVMVIGDKVRGVLHRRYASVRGDGARNIAQLIDAENLKRERSIINRDHPIPHKPGVHWDRDRVPVDYASVPPEGTRVYLRDDRAVLEGRENVDLTEEIHPGFCEIALRTRDVFGAMPTLGLDILAPDITQDPDKQVWGICEINLNASFATHHFKMTGPNRDVAGCMIEDHFPGCSLQREQEAPRDGMRVKIGMSAEREEAQDEVRLAIGLHHMHVDATRIVGAELQYDLSGPDFLVHGLHDWLARECDPSVYRVSR